MAKILLVEDDAILVEMYQAKFELEGHEVRVATNGEECLAILSDFQPGINLTRHLNAQIKWLPRSQRNQEAT
jgi:CheY-like chemotaxis protein